MAHLKKDDEMKKSWCTPFKQMHAFLISPKKVFSEWINDK